MSWLVALLAGFQVTIIGRIWVTPEAELVWSWGSDAAVADLEPDGAGVGLVRPGGGSDEKSERDQVSAER